MGLLRATAITAIVLLLLGSLAVAAELRYATVIGAAQTSVDVCIEDVDEPAAGDDTAIDCQTWTGADNADHQAGQTAADEVGDEGGPGDMSDMTGAGDAGGAAGGQSDHGSGPDTQQDGEFEGDY